MVGLLVHQNRGVLDRLVAPEKRVIFASLTVTLFLQMTSNNELGNTSHPEHESKATVWWSAQ